jgi:hypothetical protein
MAETPAKAKDVKEAGKAAAGEAIELQANPAQPGQYDLKSVKVEGEAGEEKGEEKKTYGIILELEDDQGNPVFALPSGDSVKFRIAVSGQTYEGTLVRTPVLGTDGKPKLDKAGQGIFRSRATVTGLPEKKCDVSFPGMNQGDWKKK